MTSLHAVLCLTCPGCNSMTSCSRSNISSSFPYHPEISIPNPAFVLVRESTPILSRYSDPIYSLVYLPLCPNLPNIRESHGQPSPISGRDKCPGEFSGPFFLSVNTFCLGSAASLSREFLQGGVSTAAHQPFCLLYSSCLLFPCLLLVPMHLRRVPSARRRSTRFSRSWIPLVLSLVQPPN